MDCKERREKIEAFFGEWIGSVGRPYTSNEAFAKDAGFDETAIYAWRNGKHLSNPTLRKMSALTGADMKWLMVLNGDLDEDELELVDQVG